MLDAIIHDIAGPILRRAGTAIGTFLAGAGIASDDVNTVVAGAIALGGIGIDLALIYVRNKRRY